MFNNNNDRLLLPLWYCLEPQKICLEEKKQFAGVLFYIIKVVGFYFISYFGSKCIIKKFGSIQFFLSNYCNECKYDTCTTITSINKFLTLRITYMHIICMSIFRTISIYQLITNQLVPMGT